MWRSLFLAIGIYGCLLGAQCMFLERAVLQKKETVAAPAPFMSASVRSKEISPPDWAPWSLLSFGVVTLLYSFTLPKRFAA